MLPRRWIIILAASMLYFIGYFHRVSVTVIVEDLMRDFSADATSIGFFSSLYFYPYAIMQIPAGILIDTLGSKKTLTLFCLLTSIGTMIFSISPNLLFAMIGRTLIGIGVSVAFLCTTKLIATWFDVGSFASLTGILVSIGNIGAIIATAPLALMVINLGWRLSFSLLAIATLILAFTLWFKIRDFPEKTYQSHPDFLPKISFEKLAESASGVWFSFRSRDFWVTAFPPLFFFGSFVTLQGLWGVPYITQVYHLNKFDASLLIMMIAVGFCFGAPFWGMVSDKLDISRKKVYLLGLVIYSCSWIYLTYFSNPDTIHSLPFVLLILGFSFGVMPISIVMVKELFPRKMMGAATGAANAFPFIGAALYQFIIGYFLDNFGLVSIADGVRIFSKDAYQISFAFCLVSIIFASVITLFIRGSKN